MGRRSARWCGCSATRCARRSRWGSAWRRSASLRLCCCRWPATRGCWRTRCTCCSWVRAGPCCAPGVALSMLGALLEGQPRGAARKQASMLLVGACWTVCSRAILSLHSVIIQTICLVAGTCGVCVAQPPCVAVNNSDRLCCHLCKHGDNGRQSSSWVSGSQRCCSMLLFAVLTG